MPKIFGEEMLTSFEKILETKNKLNELNVIFINYLFYILIRNYIKVSQNILFYYLDWLIRKSKKISDMMENSKRENRTGQLIQILNEENLIKLEEKFPSILHIG